MAIGIESFDDWSEWTRLETLNFELLPHSPGAYIIATRKPLTRAVSIDPDGYLDIGESSFLKKRIRDFIRCAQNSRVTGHMAGVRFARFRFSEFFPLTSLWIRYIQLPCKDDAYKVEGRLLKQYIHKYKELPPLNYKYNWSVD